MAEAEPARRLIYINWDGFAYEYYEEAMRQPRVYPGLERLTREGAVCQARTGIPSLTVPMQTTLVTGAWPAGHGNTFRYLDRETGTVMESGHINEAETIAEACRRAGLRVAAVNQFTLRGRGTAVDDPENPYVDAGPDCRSRFAAARDIWDSLQPDLLCLYCDELDAAGHNFDRKAKGLFRRTSERRRRWHLARELQKLDHELDQLLRHLESGRTGPASVVVLAADHGMTPFSGVSSLPDLLDRVGACGIKSQVMAPGDVLQLTEGIAVVTAGLQLQIYLTGALGEGRRAWRTTLEIVSCLEGAPYFGGALNREQLLARGAHPDFADILIWPAPPHHFKASNTRYVACGQHDTRHCTSTEVLLGVWERGHKVEPAAGPEPFAIDVAPTIAAFLGVGSPQGSRGRVVVRV